jgi:hypothetical protein
MEYANLRFGRCRSRRGPLLRLHRRQRYGPLFIVALAQDVFLKCTLLAGSDLVALLLLAHGVTAAAEVVQCASVRGHGIRHGAEHMRTSWVLSAVSNSDKVGRLRGRTDGGRK